MILSFVQLFIVAKRYILSVACCMAPL